MDALALQISIRKYAPILMIGCVLYYAHDFYFVFLKEPESPLLVKKNEVRTVTEETQKLKKRVDELSEFEKKLESMREDVKKIVEDLAEARKALPESVGMPDFMKLVISESKRVGLTVVSVTPMPSVKKDYYLEYPVEVRYRGVYAQLVSYLKRLSGLERIINVDKFDIKPVSLANAKYVQIEGSLRLVTFSYVGSGADGIGKEAK